MEGYKLYVFVGVLIALWYFMKCQTEEMFTADNCHTHLAELSKKCETAPCDTLNRICAERSTELRQASASQQQRINELYQSITKVQQEKNSKLIELGRDSLETVDQSHTLDTIPSEFITPVAVSSIAVGGTPQPLYPGPNGQVTVNQFSSITIAPKTKATIKFFDVADDFTANLRAVGNWAPSLISNHLVLNNGSDAQHTFDLQTPASYSVIRINGQSIDTRNMRPTIVLENHVESGISMSGDSPDGNLENVFDSIDVTRSTDHSLIEINVKLK